MMIRKISLDSTLAKNTIRFQLDEGKTLLVTCVNGAHYYDTRKEIMASYTAQLVHAAFCAKVGKERTNEDKGYDFVSVEMAYVDYDENVLVYEQVPMTSFVNYDRLMKEMAIDYGYAKVWGCD